MTTMPYISHAGFQNFLRYWVNTKYWGQKLKLQIY